MQIHKFFLVIGAFFGVIAGLMTFLISYNELIKHFATKEVPIKISMRTALATFVFFHLLSFTISFLSKYN